MKRTVAENLQYEKELFEADPIGMIRRGFLEIRTGESEPVPLVPNSTQEKIIRTVQDRRKKELPVFLFILKARQLGVSTLAQAIIYSFTSQRPNINALVVADDVDGASYIFKMNELYQEQMEKKNPHLAPTVKRGNEQRMEFESNRSRIMIDTAKNAAAGRKYTLNLVHLSEVAFYKNFKMIRQALMPAIAKKPDTIVIFETTANGINDVSKFYWKIKAAYEADPDGTDWIPMFCSWKGHLEYYREFPSEEFKESFLKSLSDKEKKIMAEHDIDPRQMYWRRRMIEDSFDGDEERFQVEYPLTDKEAFVSTSQRVFPERLTDPQKSNVYDSLFKVLPPKLTGEIELVDRRPAFVPNDKGFLKIYQESQPEEQYVIGADSCESALKHDEACGIVLKRSTWTQVAHLHGHMDPEDFAERLFALGLYYNRALLAPERNGPGLTTLTWLANHHYPNLCHQKKAVVGDNGQWEEVEEYGFHTNVKTKPVIIDQLHTSLKNLLIVVKDPVTLGQLETYVIKNTIVDGEVESNTRDGKVYIKYGAEEGHRDDCVMALAIAVHYCHTLPARRFYGEPLSQITSDRRTGY